MCVGGGVEKVESGESVVARDERGDSGYVGRGLCSRARGDGMCQQPVMRRDRRRDGGVSGLPTAIKPFIT